MKINMEELIMERIVGAIYLSCWTYLIIWLIITFLWLVNLVSIEWLFTLSKIIIPIVALSVFFNIPSGLYDGRTKEAREYDRTHDREFGFIFTNKN